jgi:hypothetical protein
MAPQNPHCRVMVGRDFREILAGTSSALSRDMWDIDSKGLKQT